MDTRVEGGPAEHAMLDLWPSSVSGDSILRANSRTGAYWRSVVSNECLNGLTLMALVVRRPTHATLRKGTSDHSADSAVVPT